MSAKRHLRELQWRLMLVAGFFIAGASLAYTYQSTLIPLLLDPLGGEKLVYLNPAGGFSFIFLVSIYAGIALAFPILIQQLYSFLKPVLPVVAQRKSTIIIISSFILLFAGILFGYMVAVPNALTFLYGFADQYIDASLTADSYLNFIIAYTIGIGIVFQLPLLLLLAHTIKPLTPGGLMKSEKWVVLIAFIIAAILTPTPDPINQAIIAGPVVIVYQIGVITILISIARSRRRAKVLARQEAKAAAKLAAQTKAALPPIPTLGAAPLLLEEEPFPDHSPVIETALTREATHVSKPVASPRQKTLAKVALSSTHLTKKATPITHVQHSHIPHTQHAVKTMDGVISRRQAPQLQVPQRPQARPAQPPVRTQQARTAGPQKGFYVDGIISTRRATSF